VSLLIAAGADITARDYFLWIPLDLAVLFGHLKCAKILLDVKIHSNKTKPYVTKWFD